MTKLRNEPPSTHCTCPCHARWPVADTRMRAREKGGAIRVFPLTHAKAWADFALRGANHLEIARSQRCKPGTNCSERKFRRITVLAEMAEDRSAQIRSEQVAQHARGRSI